MPSLSCWQRRTEDRKIICSLKHFTRIYETGSIPRVAVQPMTSSKTHHLCVLLHSPNAGWGEGMSGLSQIYAHCGGFCSRSMWQCFVPPACRLCPRWMMPLLLKDGPRSCSSGKEWWIQPALRYLGSWHNGDWTCRTSATHVWSSPNEVCWLGNLLISRTLFGPSCNY